MTQTIFLIELDSDSDIQQIKSYNKKHNDAKIIALNYLTHKILDRHNINHDVGDYYLDNADLTVIDDYSIKTTSEWYDDQKIKTLLTFDDINLGSLIEVEIWQYLTPIYKTALQITKIIEKDNPKKIISHTNLNDFVNKICRKRGIDAILSDPQTEPSLHYDVINIKYNLGKIPISFNLSRKNFLHLKNIIEKINLSFFNLESKINKKKSILLLDFNPVLYDVLLDELSGIDKNVLLLNQRRPAIWNLHSLNIIRNSKCKITRLERFKKLVSSKIEKEINILSTRLKQVWSEEQYFEQIFSVSGNTFWPSIKNGLAKKCELRFKESIERILLAHELFKNSNVSVILEWAETGQEEKEILHVSKKYGISSMILQHAMFPTSLSWNKFDRFMLGYSYPFISEKQAVWGELTKQHALSWKHDESKLLVIGSPRHDRFFNNSTNFMNKGTIILATTSVSGVSATNSPFDSYEKFEQFVIEVHRVVKKFPEKQLIVKPHPQQDFINNITELIQRIDPKIQIIYNADLVDLISSCDVLITFNDSTVALDSIILGKPTISLQIEKWAEEEDIVKMGAILSIAQIDELEPSLTKLLTDEQFRMDLITKSQKFVDVYLSNKGTASHTLAQKLDKF